MLPKSSKHYIQPTASKLNLDIELVEDAVGFYYTFLRRALVDLAHYNIQIEGLGSFKIKQKELPKLMKKYSNHLGAIEPDTFNRMAIIKETEAKLAKVLQAQE